MKRRIATAISRIEADFHRDNKPDSLYHGGLAREGWQGGYQQALMDIQVLSNGGCLNHPTSRNWWAQDERETE